MAVNYREVMETFIKRYRDDLADSALEPTFTKAVQKAIALDMFERFMMKRFDNELKQYNNNVERACDRFIMEKNLNLFNLYVEEFYALEPIELTPYQLGIQKEMRKIHNSAWAIVNDIEDGDVDEEEDDEDYMNYKALENERHWDEVDSWFDDEDDDDEYWEALEGIQELEVFEEGDELNSDEDQ